MKKLALPLLLIVNLLAACSNNNSESADTSASSPTEHVNTATEKNRSELENGAFSTEMATTTEGDSGNATTSTTAGAFVKNAEEDYDWLYYTTLNGDVAPETIMLTEINGTQYQKEADTNTSPTNSKGWEEVSSGHYDFSGIISHLFYSQLAQEEYTEEDFEAINEETTENGVSYTFVLHNETLEHMSDELIQQLEAELQTINDETSNSTGNSYLVEIAEMNLEIQRNMDYEDLSFTYTINDEDYLQQYESNLTFMIQGSAQGESYTNMQLNNYNVEQAENLLPAVNE